MVGCWHGYLSGASCRLAYSPADATASCFSKIQMVLPFWYQLTQVVPVKGPLNRCMYVCMLLGIEVSIPDDFIVTSNVRHVNKVLINFFLLCVSVFDRQADQPYHSDM